MTSQFHGNYPTIVERPTGVRYRNRDGRIFIRGNPEYEDVGKSRMAIVIGDGVSGTVSKMPGFLRRALFQAFGTTAMKLLRDPGSRKLDLLAAAVAGYEYEFGEINVEEIAR